MALQPEPAEVEFVFVRRHMAGMPLETGNLVVPEKPDRAAWLRETKDITQILFQIAVAAGVVIAIF